MKLDIGCGTDPKGDVNIDRFLIPIHRKDTLNPHAIANFIIADAHFLPFRDKAFNTVIMSHVLEHLEQPLTALKEVKRISEKAIIKVPNLAYNKIVEQDTHLFSWNFATLEHLLEQVFEEVQVIPTLKLAQRFPILRRTITVFTTFLVSRNRNELTAICRTGLTKL